MSLVCGETYVGERLIRAKKDPVLLQDRRVLKNLLDLEDKYVIHTNYFECVQMDIQPYMRQIVATWMMQVCDEQEREVDVFPLAMNYLDRFLSVCPIQRGQLQSLGSACMLLASKVKETLPLTTEKLVIYTDYSVSANDLLSFEKLLLMRLRWDVLAVTAVDFVDPIIHDLGLDPESSLIARKQALTFIHLCCTDHKFSVHPPSLIASGSVGAAVIDLPLSSPASTRQRLLKRVNQITGIDSDMLAWCLEQVEATLKANLLHVTTHPTSTTNGKNGSNGVDMNDQQQICGQITANGMLVDNVHGDISNQHECRLVDSTPTDVDLVF